ncbi:MAG: VWA domain-containing protein, partial [Acidobacteria bacterium]|nr:VWA domain-containing protein [Acidobacteriota bacterium]
QPASAAIEIAAEHKPLGASRVQLGRGSNRIRVQAHVSAAGATDIAGRISAGELGEVRFENAVTLRRPRVLLISKDPPGTEVHLLRTLEANQFEVERAHSGFPASLADFQLVLFNNWDMESLALPQKTEIESFVKQGGGLLWIAGERNVYVEKPPDQDPLERALPARLAPPRTPEGTLVVLIIDKSSSMEGKKMELARLAAIGVVENLRPVDHVGVLIFDNSFQWAVPIRKAEDRSLIKRLIAGITPDGGTQIAPALAEAYRRALPQPAVYKHVVLLTDGISEEGDSISLAREASTNRITISSVGLGQDVNRAYLEKIASFSQGKSYFLNDPSGLEQILLRDVKEHTGSTAVEKPSRAKILKEAEILEGVGMESAPPLAGYIRFISKPTADTILAVDGRDPLFARWQFGLGRAAVFASDAKSRWAAEWVAWPGFDRFWANVLRDLLPHSPPSEAVVDYDGAQDELVVDYRFGSHLEEPARIPDIFALGPNGFRAPVKLSKMAAGHYRGRVPVENGEGLFRIRPLEESRAFPEAGFYRQEEELAGFGSDLPLLRRMAASTGGRLSPDPQRAFDPEGRAVERSMQLWPGLLALAILLNLAELVMRKWRGLAESLRIAPRPAPATAAAQVTSKAS